MKRTWLAAALPLAVGVAACGDLPTQGPSAAVGVGPNWSQSASTPDVIMYGTEDGANRGDLWKLNLTTGAAEKIWDFAVDPSGDPTSPNGVAFDAANGRLYFAVNSSDRNVSFTPDRIFMFDVNAPAAPVHVGDVDNTVYSADFHDGGYYFVPNRRNDLVRLDFDANGFQTTTTTVCTAFRAGEVSFGDIAIRDGVVYGSARINLGPIIRFFRLNLATCAYEEWEQSYTEMLQLAWGSDGVLYGHTASTGQWWTVNASNGSISGEFFTDPVVGLSDIAAAPAPPPPPPGGIHGCTPGYWRNHAHRWEGYTTGQGFNAVFSVLQAQTGKPNGETLLQAVMKGGGGWSALGRHAVAALLNAAHPDVDYELTTAQVIAKVQAAAAHPGLVETIKDELEGFNERGCPLSGGPAQAGASQGGPGQGGPPQGVPGKGANR